MEHMLLTADNVTVVSNWASAVVVEEIDPTDSGLRTPALNVKCGYRVKRASIGDHVIKHEDGTFDVMGPLAWQQSIHQES